MVFIERIWVNPRKSNRVFYEGVVEEMSGGLNKSKLSGKIIDKSWPSEKSFDITELPKQNIDDWFIYRASGHKLSYEERLKYRFKFCIDHWVNGTSWQDTGAYDFFLSAVEILNIKTDKCYNINDIYNRYNNLDRVFEQVKREGRLRTIEEVDPSNSWEEKEPMVHIGPNLECYFQPHGVHRFAIAYILDLKLPAQLGLVHISSLPYLHFFKKPV